MIVSFANDGTCDIHHSITSHKSRHILPEALLKVAHRKLDMLNSAHRLDDLHSLPGNRLEVLSGPRKGFFSIRINDQFRLVFEWSKAGAEKVEITDYHHH